MMHREKGFSLIELMAVIAIIGILATIAVPSYQKYIMRAKVASTMSMHAALVKEMIMGHSDGTWPTTFTTPAGVSAVTITGSTANQRVLCFTLSDTAFAGANQYCTTITYADPGGYTTVCGPGTTDPVSITYMPKSCVGP